MKRFQQIVVSLTLIMVLLAGCGNTEESTHKSWIEDVQQSSETISDAIDRKQGTTEESTDKVLTESKSDGEAELVNEAESTLNPSDSNYSTFSESGGSATESAEYIASDNLDSFKLSLIQPYSGDAYVAVNGNIPYFDVAALTAVSVEYYSPLDNIGRCGMAYACIGQDLMPTEERGSIGMVKPTGWHTVKYDCVDGGYLYNRCHLIGYQLSGENANTSNLITGTRYLNIQGMLPFENMVADYVKETANHVAYRVTPIFEGDNLLAEGVLMEGYSVEDQGDGICFCVFAYNVQPGVSITYSTGDSALEEQETNTSAEDEKLAESTSLETSSIVKEPVKEEPVQSENVGTSYVLNINTKKFHYPSCSSVGQMKESNKEEYVGSRDDLISKGYSPCGRCHP